VCSRWCRERKRYKGPFWNLPSTPTSPLLLLSPTESPPHPHDAPSQRHATSLIPAFYRSAGDAPQPPTARLPTDVGAHLPVRSSLSAPHLIARRGTRPRQAASARSTNRVRPLEPSAGLRRHTPAYPPRRRAYAARSKVSSSREARLPPADSRGLGTAHALERPRTATSPRGPARPST